MPFECYELDVFLSVHKVFLTKQNSLQNFEDGKFSITTTLTMKGQNIGSSTKKNPNKYLITTYWIVKNENIYMSLGSFKSHTYCSIAKNGSVGVYQN